MNEALAGFSVVASSSSDNGTLYVVPEDTAADLDAIESVKIGSNNSAGAGVDTTIVISPNPSMSPETKFAVYAVDENGIVSEISDTAFTVDYSNTDSIVIGSSVVANVPSLGGKHVFSVNLTAGQQYTFTTSNSHNSGGIEDPTLKLWLHDGEKFILVDSDDDSAGGVNNLEAQIILPANQSQTATYYIMVEAFADGSIGTTTVSLTNS